LYFSVSFCLGYDHDAKPVAGANRRPIRHPVRRSLLGEGGSFSDGGSPALQDEADGAAFSDHSGFPPARHFNVKRRLGASKMKGAK
jgi:hypothetical protein